MATARITLKSVGYPKIAPYSIMVLQSLEEVGFDIVLKDMKYKDRDTILNYFLDHNINVSFKSVKDPDIDITDYEAVIGVEFIKNCTPNDLWERVDRLCIINQVYERQPLYNFIPTYELDSYFLVYDYGMKSQLVDSKPISIKGAHTKGSRVMNSKPALKTIDVVDSSTFQIVEHFDLDKNKFIPATEEVYFNLAV